MKAIVAVDLNWGIGYRGNLLQHIPEDMKFFKNMTIGKIVVMGRETFESLPGKNPLKDRVNIVLSRSQTFNSDGITVCSSLEELFAVLRKYNTDDVFIIGGQSIYRQLLPYCTEVYVTKILKIYKADKYFVNLDIDQGWNLVYESEIKDYNGIKYRFTKYLNTSIGISGK